MYVIHSQFLLYSIICILVRAYYFSAFLIVHHWKQKTTQQLGRRRLLEIFKSDKVYINSFPLDLTPHLFRVMLPKFRLKKQSTIKIKCVKYFSNWSWQTDVIYQIDYCWTHKEKWAWQIKLLHCPFHSNWITHLYASDCPRENKWWIMIHEYGWYC